MGDEASLGSNEIIFYQNDKLSSRIEVKVQDQTIWLTQAQIVSLFESSKSNISEHIKHIFQTGELSQYSTVRKIRTVQKEGARVVERKLVHYNLDMIISIGYRVNSIRGTQFRIWANKILKDHLLKGYSLNRRMNRIEDSLDALKGRMHGVELSVQSTALPKQGIFFDGQVFDAHVFAHDLIKNAEKSIIVIDNYINEETLNLLSNKQKDVKLDVYTKELNARNELALKRFQQQYPKTFLHIFTRSHDRFIIIDEKDIYHLGASLKDLGKKWFAFTKLNMDVKMILEELRSKVAKRLRGLEAK